MSVLLVQPHGKVIAYLLIRLSNHSQRYTTPSSALFTRKKWHLKMSLTVIFHSAGTGGVDVQEPHARSQGRGTMACIEEQH